MLLKKLSFVPIFSALAFSSVGFAAQQQSAETQSPINTSISCPGPHCPMSVFNGVAFIL